MLQFSQEYETLRKIAGNPDCFATTLYVIALRLFGTEIHEWEPEMFEMEFKDELQLDLPPLNQSKLIALVTAIVSNSFYRDFMPFTVTCELLNGNEENFQSLTPDLLPAEMAWGVTEVLINDNDDPQFDPEIAVYTGVILHENGFFSPPRPLDYAKMPERYMGSTESGVIKQMEEAQFEHVRLIDEYLNAQASDLFEELQQLPWVNDELMEEVVGEINRTSFRTRLAQPAVL